MRILLVEDSKDSVTSIRRAVAISGVACRLDIARDAREALAMLARQRFLERKAEEYTLPQLVMLDMGLPDISGLSVLKQMKVSPRLRTIPVVLLVDSTSEEQCGVAMGPGAVMYLLKPPAGKDVANVVRACRGLEESSPRLSGRKAKAS